MKLICLIPNEKIIGMHVIGRAHPTDTLSCDRLLSIVYDSLSIRSASCYSSTGMGADEMLQGFGVAIKMVRVF